MMIAMSGYGQLKSFCRWHSAAWMRGVCAVSARLSGTNRHAADVLALVNYILSLCPKNGTKLGDRPALRSVGKGWQKRHTLIRESPREDRYAKNGGTGQRRIERHSRQRIKSKPPNPPRLSSSRASVYAAGSPAGLGCWRFTLVSRPM